MRRLMPLFFIFMLLIESCSNSINTALTRRPTITVLPSMSAQGEKNGDCPAFLKANLSIPPANPVSLTVMGWSSTTAEDNLVRNLLDDFQRLHPWITLKWISVSGNYPDTMGFLTAQGKLPDVFFMRPDMAPAYIAKQKLLNLSPYMQRDQVKTSEYYPILFTPFVCNSTVYGIPKDWNTLGIVYNKTLFRQAGLAFPNNTWTWNNLRLAVRKLTHVTSKGVVQYGISLPALSSRWLAFLFANGGTVLNASQTQSAFTTPAAVDALKFYSSMQLEDHASILPNMLNASWPGPVFGAQQAAMVIEGGWLIPFLKENYPNVDYGIAPLPLSLQSKRANLLFTNAWAANAATKYPEASWELIQYMTSTAAQTRILNSGLALPSLAELGNDPFLQQQANMQTLFKALPYSTLDYYGKDDTFIHSHLDIAIQNVLTGKMSAQNALMDAASQIDSVLSP